ncbi:MAG: preprotein translocase subunit SecG [Clostridia bacterium]|nr:preprotein translocase subunit SecG [Clostridia bacterium]
MSILLMEAIHVLNIIAFAASVPVLSYIKIAIAALALVAAGFIIFVVLQQKGNSDGMEAMTGSTRDDDNESYYGQNSASRRERVLKRWTFICAGVIAVACIAMIILNSIA